jgi:long-chain acyl-CoA synthetase
MTRSSTKNVKTLLDIWKTSAMENASRTAVVERDMTVNYKSLQTGIASLAAQLRNAGVCRGDRIALLFSNNLEFVTSFFAIVSLGAIAVPLNRQYQHVDIIRILGSCAVSLLVTSTEFASLCRQALTEYQERCALFLIEDREDLFGLAEKPMDDFKVEVDRNASVTLLLSSGSTGNPKRIGRTHANLVFELRSLIKTLNVTPEDRILGVAPFSHVNGLTRSMLASLAAGAALYPLAKFDRQVVAETIEKEKISIFIGVPFMFAMLAKTNFQRQPNFSSLRLCVSASAPMPAELNRRFYERFGIYVRQLYGSTETGTITVDLSRDIEKSLDSVGTPIAGVELEIFTETGKPVGLNEVGEIAVKSAAVIKNYDGCEELNREAFEKDYFLTGDLGRRDEKGLLYLVGRKKLFINRGGYKVNPREVEDWLKTHPKVEEAVVVGLPTPYGDEKIKAVIVLNDISDEEEIIEHCRGRIADFKIPTLIEFRDKIPVTPTGKIQREMLL